MASWLRVTRGRGFVLVRAARKTKEAAVVVEFTLLPQLVEWRVSRLYRVDECLPAIIITFCLCELDLFV